MGAGATCCTSIDWPALRCLAFLRRGRVAVAGIVSARAGQSNGEPGAGLCLASNAGFFRCGRPEAVLFEDAVTLGHGHQWPIQLPIALINGRGSQQGRLARWF
jgi:hypothetical protein